MIAQERELAERLFAEALALPREQQSAFLAQNSVDVEVQREVESLLAFATRPLTGITEAVENTASALAAPISEASGLARTALTSRIRQGGMRGVYRAVRDDDQLQKTVAVKMLRFPDGEPAMLERFRQERQIRGLDLVDGCGDPAQTRVCEKCHGAPSESSFYTGQCSEGAGGQQRKAVFLFSFETDLARG